MTRNGCVALELDWVSERVCSSTMDLSRRTHFDKMDQYCLLCLSLDARAAKSDTKISSFYVLSLISRLNYRDEIVNVEGDIAAG